MHARRRCGGVAQEVRADLFAHFGQPYKSSFGRSRYRNPCSTALLDVSFWTQVQHT